MGFHKEKFPIRLNNLSKEPIEVVQGWVDESRCYGFHKWGRYWKVTDLDSGLLITTEGTRAKCWNWVQENMTRIKNRYEDPWYADMVREFRELIANELESLKGE